MSKKHFEANRFSLKDTIRQQIDFSRTSQSQHLPAPPLQKPCPPNVPRIDLPNGQEALTRLGRMPVGEVIAFRESVRQYKPDSLTLEELSALLWATQGVRCLVSPESALRSVPSAGARHAFETYLVVNRVKTLPAKFYRWSRRWLSNPVLPPRKIFCGKSPDKFLSLFVTTTAAQ